MVCICMLMAYLLLWLRSKYRNLDLCQGGGGGGGDKTIKSYKQLIYIHISCKCDTNRAGHFTLDAHASRPVACLIYLWRSLCVALKFVKSHIEVRVCLCVKFLMLSSWWRHHFPCYWPFLRGVHRSPVNSHHKGQWRGALIFSLVSVWINGWVNNREADDLRRYHTHCDVTVMKRLYNIVLISQGAIKCQPNISYNHRYI